MPHVVLILKHQQLFKLFQHPLLPFFLLLIPLDLLKCNLESSYFFKKLHKLFNPDSSFLKIATEKVHGQHFG